MILGTENLGGSPDPGRRKRATVPAPPSPQLVVDLGNVFEVVPTADHRVQFKLPDGLTRYKIDAREAVNLAAWLIAFLDPDEQEFRRVIEKIKGK